MSLVTGSLMDMDINCLSFLKFNESIPKYHLNKLFVQHVCIARVTASNKANEFVKFCVLLSYRKKEREETFTAVVSLQ